MPELAIEVKNLKKSFADTVVLNGINISVPRGTVYALLGPNGAGKTTAVRIMTTLLESDSGSVMIEGVDVLHNPDAARAIIGLTGQNASVDEKLSGIANLEMIASLYHLSKEEVKRRSIELIKQFELEDAATRLVKTYSGGMRRRLDLAASLITEPPVLFLDEPTTGLDPHSRNRMWEVIRKLVQKGTTLLLTTQYLEEADALANQIAVLNGGKIIAEGTASELKRSLGGDRYQLFFEKEDDLDTALEKLKKFSPHRDSHKLSLTIEIHKGFKEIAAITQLVAESNISVTHARLKEPTLDDVFLTLTGHTTETSL